MELRNRRKTWNKQEKYMSFLPFKQNLLILLTFKIIPFISSFTELFFNKVET